MIKMIIIKLKYAFINSSGVWHVESVTGTRSSAITLKMNSNNKPIIAFSLYDSVSNRLQMFTKR